MIETHPKLVRGPDNKIQMSQEYIYVYKACQIVIHFETEQRWTYIVIFEDQHYEPYPPRTFDSEEEALKAATAFCDIRIDNVTPIDSFHRRKKISMPVL
jgi:hypothetical protein